MKSVLKVYDVVLTVHGPMFIGSGQDIKKKEYIYDKRRRKIMIPKLEKMYSDLCKMGKQREYERYMLTDNRTGLGEWLEQQRVPESYLKAWKAYELDCGDYVGERGKTLEVRSCVKDAYGNPYIPGSSLKGMIRTCLLAYDIRKNPEKYKSEKQNIQASILKNEKVRRNSYLIKEEKAIEEVAFHKLGRTEKRYEMVNDYMSGVIISDSAPLSVDDLVLCQKVEEHTDGVEKRLNLLRECVKPDTVVHFQMTLDMGICKTSAEEILKAIAEFSNSYYQLFSGKFPHVDRPAENVVWLGGGAGYVSKTVVYALFGKEGVRLIPQIYRKTEVPREHKHDQDAKKGVSPHILKLTQYQGKRYQFGECTIELKEII